MENQHKLIKGYRDLSKEEIDMMNEAKELLAKCKELSAKVDKHINNQYSGLATDSSEYARLCAAHPGVWRHEAEMNIETGFMQLIRSIAQPTT